MTINKTIKIRKGYEFLCISCHSREFNLVITDTDFNPGEVMKGNFNVVCKKCGSAIFSCDMDFLIGTDGFEVQGFHYIEGQYTEQEVEDENYGGFVKSGVRTVIKEVKRKRPRKTNDSQ